MRTSQCRPAARRPFHRKTPARLLAALLLALLAAGCGSDGNSMDPDDDSPSDDNGGGGATFSVTVNGAESFVSSGTLAFSGGSAAEHGWEVQLQSLDIADQLRSIEIDGDGDRPGPGTYTIVSTQEQAASNEFYARCRTASGESYDATSGTLTIASSSDATVKGTFAFAGESSTGAAVAVSGSFRADDLLDE